MNSFILYSLLFLFGGALGSFAGVIVDRLYIKSFLTGRSNCDSCNKRLNWYELIPVLSYLLLRGRCKKCKVKIGKEKFWTELFGSIFMIFTYNIYISKYFSSSLTKENIISGLSVLLLAGFLYIIISVIIFYDLKHKMVPTNFSLLLIIIGVSFEIYKIFNYKIFYGGINNLFWLDLFSGFLIALPFLLIYFLSKKKGVGFGDIIIYFAVGYLSGFIFGVSIFFISIWLGAIISIYLIIFYPKKYSRKSAIPFAPFILIATILVAFLQIDILGILQIVN